MNTPVLSLKDFNSNTLRIGSLVANEVIDTLRNNLPPVLDWNNLFQAGGAVCDRQTGDSRLLPAYTTFRRVTDAVWEYCGSCLRTESTERGEVPFYECI